ncbi:hypothetical protein B0H66DRAFT_57521 [Apodospora peruviana]|uniref:Uncharacterized protein n=1 Tax=Apodospora peruviana TaxID=516989 RepID=A0AAE0ISH1_9PEZI|nr:hypothetical protein B0H66DRAFT_57521 [Apodospora peruviana]
MRKQVSHAFPSCAFASCTLPILRKRILVLKEKTPMSYKDRTWEWCCATLSREAQAPYVLRSTAAFGAGKKHVSESTVSAFQKVIVTDHVENSLTLRELSGTEVEGSLNAFRLRKAKNSAHKEFSHSRGSLERIYESRNLFPASSRFRLGCLDRPSMR